MEHTFVITQTRTTCVNCNSDKVLHDASYRYFVLLRGKALTISSEATATYTSPLFRNHKFVKNCTHLSVKHGKILYNMSS